MSCTATENVIGISLSGVTFLKLPPLGNEIDFCCKSATQISVLFRQSVSGLFKLYKMNCKLLVGLALNMKFKFVNTIGFGLNGVA